MSMGMIRLGRAGIGEVTAFYDEVPGSNAAATAAMAAAALEAAKKAQTAVEAERLLENARLLKARAAIKAEEEAKAKVVEADKVTVVETGKGTGEILGMDSSTMLLLAGAVGLWVVLGKKGG